MNDTVRIAVEKYAALLELENATSTRTTKARNAILRSLNDEDLATVSLELKKRGLIGRGAK